MERRQNQRQLPSKWDKIFNLIKSKFAFWTTPPVDAGSLGDEQELLINGPPQKESSSTPNRDNTRPALLQVEIQHDHSGSGKMIMVSSEDVVDLKTVHDIPLGEPKKREWELNINDEANDFMSVREQATTTTTTYKRFLIVEG